MNIIELIRKKRDFFAGNKVPTIAFLGDSVTQGCFEAVLKSDDGIDTVFDTPNAYHSHLKSMLSTLYPEAPVNIINGGISGDTTNGGMKRYERDILSYHPDLTVICYGLNDCLCDDVTPALFESNLDYMINEFKNAGSEVIVLTPNMMNNTVVDEYQRFPSLKEASDIFANAQNGGLIDSYVDILRRVAEKNNVPLCDVYAKWKMLDACGVHTEKILANHLNHPTRDMHKVTALCLIETMMSY